MAKARGWCPAHYERWKRNGEPGPAGDARKMKPRRVYAYIYEPSHPLAHADGYVAEHRKVRTSPRSRPNE